MTGRGEHIVDGQALARARAQLGSDFPRILGYFRDDGAAAVDQIEAAMRAKNAVALVMPAHTLKREASHFGAVPLCRLAEHIELTARSCIESHDSPDELIGDVLTLRPLFEQTMALLEREPNPMRIRGSFGRRIA